MKKLLLITLLLISFVTHAQKIKYTINNGLQIEGVDQTNPVIFDNDMVQDTPDIFYLWLKANRKEVNLVGNINTRDLHPASLSKSHDVTFNVWNKFYNAYTSNGMKNVPAPVKGSARYFNASSLENSAGTDLIIAEAKKASAQKPLVIFVGGQVTSIANAVLKDRSIASNLLVLHVDGYGETGYNAIDDKACLELINNGVRYINWSGNLYSWYNKAGSPGYSGSNKMPGINLNGMPSNSFSNELRNNWFNQAFAQWGDIGDAPPIFYFFNHALWQNVVRKNVQKQTVTTDNFAYLLVSDNKWADYGPMLNSYVVSPTSYIPVTTTPPPVNNPPSVSIANTTTTVIEGPIVLMANAADSDGSVAKVEFFVDAVKVGEDAILPYDFTWTASKGIYQVTAKATDDKGLLATSAAVVFTVNSVGVPPDTTKCCKDGNTPVVSVGTTTTVPYTSPAKVVGVPNPGGVVLNFEIPQGFPGQNTGGGTTGNLQQYKIYSVTDYGATGNGVTDDLPAIKRATDDAIRNKGKLIFPPAPNFYRINSTWEINLPSESQLWLDIEMIGTRRGYGIVYMGPSNGKAVRFMGNKAGMIQGLKVKIGDGITNTIGIHITTGQYGVTSTSCFTFSNCEVEVNTGINNDAWVLGEDFSVIGDDISQILFSGCSAWGVFPAGDNLNNLPKGQSGWEVRGINTLQLTWIGGGVTYLETGINVIRSGSAFFYGFGGSRVGTFFKLTWANNFTIDGGRHEYYRKFLEVNSGGHPIVTIKGSPMTEDFVPLDGKLIEFNSAGTLILDGCKFDSNASKPMFDARAITLGGSGGAFFMRGGAIKNTTQDLLTATPGWRLSVQNVARLNDKHENVGYFTNR